jgi:glycosyltransferase involved in cell wall biosynthesis
MKVLFINVLDDAADGGCTEMTLYHLTQGLINQNIEPVLLSTSSLRGLQVIERNGVRIWRAGLRNMYWPSMKIQRPSAARLFWHVLDSYNAMMQPLLRQVLRAERPDVVSVHNLPGWSAAAWKTIADMGIPMVQVLHDYYNICPKGVMYREGEGNCAEQCMSCRLLRLPHRALSRRVSAVIGVSRFILDRHLQAGYFENVSMQRVIHNARDAAELGVLDASERTPGKSLRIGFIGRLDHTKGVEVVLQSFLDANLPDAELWIAGNGKTDYIDSLRMRYNDQRIHFLGSVKPRDFYPQIDVIVVPSHWHDTFPGVVFEALAFGKPVIGSRRGGIPEMIQDGENGLLFEPDRPEELVAAIPQLAGNTELRVRMAETARCSSQVFLNRENWVSSYLNLYREVIN